MQKKRTDLTRTTINLFLLQLTCIFLLAACSGNGPFERDIRPSNTTSGSVGPFVETANIQLKTRSFYLTSSTPGKEGMIIDVLKEDPLERLRVGPGDTLRVTLNGVPQLVEEVEGYGCQPPFGPCDYAYYYRVMFTENTESQPVTISLERAIGVSSQSTGTFPSRPTITTPAPGTVISLSTDTLSISWQPENAGDETKLTVSGTCLMAQEVWFVDPDSSYSFPPERSTYSSLASMKLICCAQPVFETMRLIRPWPRAVCYS